MSESSARTLTVETDVVAGRWPFITQNRHRAAIALLCKRVDEALESEAEWAEINNDLWRQHNVLWAWFSVLAIVAGVGWGLAVGVIIHA